MGLERLGTELAVVYRKEGEAVGAVLRYAGDALAPLLPVSWLMRLAMDEGGE